LNQCKSTRVSDPEEHAQKVINNST
jgi:hypothetical protein